MRKIMLILICALLICAFFLGSRLDSTDEIALVAYAAASEESAQWNLHISLTSDYTAGLTTIPLEQGNYKEISYLNVSNVTINIDGTGRKLEDALREGAVTVDELIAWVRKDASEGFCREVAKSKNGLTEFTYRYGEFTVHYVYDLYETPNRGKCLLTHFLICDSRSESHFRPVDEQTGESLDYEDWGLRFDISKADPSGITLSCCQSGGQQLGTLNIGTHILYKLNSRTLAFEQLEPLTTEGEPSLFTGYRNGFESWTPDPNRFLTMGGEKELYIPLGRLYGLLSAGDYEIVLQIVDCYNEEEVHPLMRNYRDDQWYSIEFTVE